MSSLLPPRPRALRRAARAREAMSACTLCAFRCNVDRTAGPAGKCRSDAVPRVFHEGIEWGGEEALVPTYVVSLSGCNMTCSFCLTGPSSQNGAAGTPLDADAVGARIRAAAPMLRSVTILGGEPSIHLGGALEIAARVPPELRLVWKSNAYASAEGRRLLRGVPDVVLADYKFGNDRCAERLAGIPDYTRVVRANLRWARRSSELMLRHLLMPGHLDCCLQPVLEWTARELPGVPFTLMTGYLPLFRAADDPLLGRSNRREDCVRAEERARASGVRIARWVLVPPPAVPAAPADEVWVDPSGRICVDSASAGLASVLRRLEGEFVLHSIRP